MTVVGHLGLAAFRDWASWRKLEPGLRAAIAARDFDLAACYCDRYPTAVVSPVITSIIREMKHPGEAGISQLVRIKRAWRSATRAKLSKLTAPIKYLHAITVALPLAALCIIAFDLALYYQGPPHCFAPVEFNILSDFPILIAALSIAVLSSLLQQGIEARVLELKRTIDDLATDMILSFVESGGKLALPAYKAGNWKQSEDTSAAAARAS
jgi:hypothetical protein